MACKVAIVGPARAGKSRVANALASQSTDIRERSYKPTVGTRILETDIPLPHGEHSAVELWDLSGDHRLDQCWPAVVDGLSAVILVYSPNNRGHLEEIELWYEYFVQKPGISSRNCIAFIWERDSGGAPSTERRSHQPCVITLACNANSIYTSSIPNLTSIGKAVAFTGKIREIIVEDGEAGMKSMRQALAKLVDRFSS